MTHGLMLHCPVCEPFVIQGSSSLLILLAQLRQSTSPRGDAQIPVPGSGGEVTLLCSAWALIVSVLVGEEEASSSNSICSFDSSHFSNKLASSCTSCIFSSIAESCCWRSRSTVPRPWYCWVTSDTSHWISVRSVSKKQREMRTAACVACLSLDYQVLI